jgi:F0F1-type ATP synthase membrane subunit b/b'
MKLLRAAEGKIESDIATARAGLKSEMAGLITEATEAILVRNLDDKSDQKTRRRLSERVYEMSADFKRNKRYCKVYL